jgi:hypothetical protein
MKNQNKTIEVELNEWYERELQIAYKLDNHNTPQNIINGWLDEMISYENEYEGASDIVNDELKFAVDDGSEEYKNHIDRLNEIGGTKKFKHSFQICLRHQKFLKKIAQKCKTNLSNVLLFLLMEYLEVEVDVPNPEEDIDPLKYSVYSEEDYIALLKRRGLI